MHKLHECVTKEIDEIVECGLSYKNIDLLGKLVDIRKDIEEMWHWRSESGDINVENGEVSTRYVDLIKDVEYLNRIMRSSDAKPEHRERMKSDMIELLRFTTDIKRLVDEAKMDADLVEAFKKVFR